MNNNKKGFTLAEVLITLTIIGVVAALTIPSLLANVSEKTYDAKRKGLATRMAQAISQIDVINSYKAIAPTGSTETEYSEKYSSVNFITEALSKAYKIATICDYSNLVACNIPNKVGKTLENSSSLYNLSDKIRFSNLNPNLTADALGGMDTYAAAFTTKNGESILLYYNPNCVPEQITMKDATGYEVKNFAKEVCLNMIYDLDGSNKGANIVGKDVGFMTVFYSDAPYLVAPTPIFAENGSGVSYGSTTNNVSDRCYNMQTFGYGKGNFSLMSREDLYSIGINNMLYSLDGYAWSSTFEGSDADDYGWQVYPKKLLARKALRSETASAYCVLESLN